MKSRLHPLSRALLALSVLVLPVCYFVPLWQIQLWAPQYPEGLNMKIWINKLSGAFEIINGLNHYIGMAMIREEMFPEFKFMIYLLGGLIALGLVAVASGTRKWLWIYVVVLALGGLAGLIDFYRWGYNYGHNLDPHAAIQVPGMSYQPPLIGYKNLLNFTAFSGPDIGGWILIVSGTIAGLLLGWEQFLRKPSLPSASIGNAEGGTVTKVALATLLAGTASACNASPEPFRFGQDECAECKMTITDRRFGAQLITRKGKILKFDDLTCVESYLRGEAARSESVRAHFVSDFHRPGEFIPLQNAWLLKSPKLKSPMRGDTAAFASAEELRRVRDELGGGEESRWMGTAAAP
jgi:copper chaperone NosL